VPARESRKVVTALFSDVVESTSLGETLDPEVVRGLLGRYFEDARETVERHGGTTEKFIGDAVVALFGVPVTREDDALRALRAADEMRRRLADLNEELERAHGVRIEVRTGVNTGEVVVGSDSELEGFRASGDTMNVAARLEQAAAPGEILVGALTRELGGEAVEVEAVEPLVLKGKAAPVDAFRLVRVLPDASPYARRQDAPLVGREQQLAALRAALEESIERRECRLVTVVGAAGVGKSRLAREFAESLRESARVLVGRCVSYGEGVTFLPVAEALRPLLGDDVRRGVAELLQHDGSCDLVADQVASALGAGTARTSTEDAFWAIRKLLEAIARDRPLVFVVDDVHWAEPTLLDLLEYASTFSASAPILVLALTRPDLLEERPTWAAPRERTAIVRLDPLPERDAVRLAEHLVEADVGEAELRRLVDAADGNPLFLEQLLALNADDTGELVVPPTIQALLAARIDRVDPDERLILEYASVEGREFHRDVLGDLLPESRRADVGAHLLSLARRQFIRAVVGEGPRDTYAFAHGLMRDAAYAALPKGERARLHLRLATYLESRPDVPGEQVGFHLADAVRLRRELGQDGDETRGLAERAAERLVESADRSLGMGDDRAASRLLERACELVPVTEHTGRLLRAELGRAFAGAGPLDRAREVFTELLDGSRESGDDPVLELRAELGLASLRAQTDRSLRMDDLVAVAERAIPTFEEAGDDRGLARAWFLVHWARFRLGRNLDSIEAAESAVEHSAAAGDRREQLRALGAIAMATCYAPMPLVGALRACDELDERAAGGRLVHAFTERVRGRLSGLAGRFDEGREHCRRSVEIYEELGHPLSATGVVMELQHLERHAGRPEVAERELRAAYDVLHGLNDVGYVSWVAAALARVLAEQGRADEALELARIAREDLQRDLAFGQVNARLAEAMAYVATSQTDDAEAGASEALELVERTDYPELRADVRVLLARLDRDAGRDAQARERLAEALALYESKGDAVSVARVRDLG
jgi:class 3 adenylate cyclase/tetratricopeptide (TPR) repeat protein